MQLKEVNLLAIILKLLTMIDDKLVEMFPLLELSFNEFNNLNKSRNLIFDVHLI